MTTVVFDTLKLARRLEAAGFTAAQAQGASEALAETLSEEMVTRTYMDGNFKELRLELDTRFKDLQLRIGGMIFALGGVLVAIKFLER